MGKEVREKRRIFCCDAARFCLRCLHYFQERFFLTHKFTQLSIHVRTSTCTVYAHIPPRSLSLSSLPTLRLIKLPLPMRPRTRPRCMQYTVQCISLDECSAVRFQDFQVESQIGYNVRPDLLGTQSDI